MSCYMLRCVCAGIFAVIILLVHWGCFDIQAEESSYAEAILENSDVEGGLVVVVGAKDVGLLSGLRPNQRYLVHALDTDIEDVQAARESLRTAGLYGNVSVDRFDGQSLPYVEDLANLVVVTEQGDLAIDEIMRITAPEGVVLVRRGDSWSGSVKPRPDTIDDWSHFLHDAGGNAVAQDSEVGSPNSLRWVADPQWCRSHEFPSSVAACITTGGRIISIIDEGPSGVYEKLPMQCNVVARDAFNGVLLWKVPLRMWQPEFGTGTGNRWNIHHTIPRRLVADHEKVYVTLNFAGSPVSILDAATGEILVDEIEGTEGADELLLSDGVLIVKATNGRSVAATARFGKEALDDALIGVDATTGEVLWRNDDVRVAPYALSAQDGKVVYHNIDELVCLDAKTGETLWRTPNTITSTLGGSSTLVINDGVVLFHGHGKTPVENDDLDVKSGQYLTVLNLEDGSLLWRRPGRGSLAAACTQPTDIFVVKGVVWLGASLDGYDLRTGQVTQTLEIGKLVSPGHHHRCHRAKATERFLIWPKRGAEFIDVESDEHMRNDWLRAPCFTGAMPANGLFYAPSDQCFCYPGVKVSGFMAMATLPKETPPTVASTDDALERGPLYGIKFEAIAITPGDWPMHRKNEQRSGSTSISVPAELEQAWEVNFACPATQPVVVGDKLWTVEKDEHRIVCLNAVDGSGLWSFTAGGRIDSSPTISRGRVLFGCRDGYVYCLNANDGLLIWKFRAAPCDQRLVSYGQVESVWPVHGSILVQDNVAYFAAGRSSYLDGGIFVYGLDVMIGKVLYSHKLEGPWPDISTDVGTPFAMEGALPDLIVSDGENLYMQRIKFDAELNRLETIQESSLGELDMGENHLVPTGGFLDDTGFDRLYWMYSQRWPGFYFSQYAPKSGQLVVFDETTTFAVKYFYRRVQWSPIFYPEAQGYLLFADDNDNQPVLQERGDSVEVVDWLPEGALSDSHRRGGRGTEKGTGYVRAEPTLWQEMIPTRVRAMVLADDRLFTIGLPDVLEEGDPLASFEGRLGSRLEVFSAEDGASLASYDLESAPAFDGLIAAGGKLYLATADGKLICFEGVEE
jgi:outer membrane protein assembly factor BamB